MALMIKLAWRNIFRNKRRTVIAGIAIGVGLAALIFTDAWIEGMKRSMIQSATAAYLGEGQIHAQGFRLSHEVDKTIQRPAAVIAALEQDGEVKAFAPRAESFGMITSPANVSSVMLVGVDPAKERRLSRIAANIRQGSFFEDSGERDIIIGSELAVMEARA